MKNLYFISRLYEMHLNTILLDIFYSDKQKNKRINSNHTLRMSQKSKNISFYHKC